MNIEVLLTEAEIADEFAEAMEARDLPEKFFYWTPLSVRAWKELAAGANESLRQTWDALALKAGELTKSFGARVPVISFGAGHGTKDRIILKALREAGREVKYFPVDASQTSSRSPAPAPRMTTAKLSASRRTYPARFTCFWPPT